MNTNNTIEVSGSQCSAAIGRGAWLYMHHARGIVRIYKRNTYTVQILPFAEGFNVPAGELMAFADEVDCIVGNAFVPARMV